MIKYTIQFNINELNDDLKNQVDSYLRKLIDRFIKDNNIKTLHKIIFTDDWDKELTDFQKENNLPVEYTDSQYGAASAKTLKIKVEKNIKTVIFYRKEMLVSMVQQQGFGILHLFHELSHIYYYEKIGSGLDELKKRYKESTNLLENTKYFGLIMWEEYFVSRYLCPYLFGSTDCYIEILIEQYKEMKKDIEKAITDYRYNDDINKLFNLAQQQMTLIATYSAYSCGMVNFFNDKENKLYRETCDILKKETGLVEIWDKMYKIYNQIFMTFPELKNIDSKLADLSKLFIEIYNHFGIYPEQLDNGRLYISVPL